MKLLAPQIEKIADRARDLRRRAAVSRQWLAGLARNTSMSHTPVLAEAIAFQDPIDQICEEPPPRFMREVLYVVLVLFVTILVVAAVVKVDIVVVGAGRLVTETPPIMLQPLDRSIVREVKVRPGDTVTKGQVLATLDPTFTQADLASLSAKQKALMAQLRRLEAEQESRPFEIGPAPTPDEQLQLSLYRQRQAQYASQLRVLDEAIAQRRANIRTIEDERAALAKQLEIARQIETMRSTMLEKQSGSRLNFLEAQSARMLIEGNYNTAGNRLAELRHELEAKEAERQAFIDQWRNQIVEQLVATRTEAAMISEGLSKAALLNDLVVLAAPEDGVVLEVAKRAVGSVINAAEPLITIIKSNSDMIAEVMIASGDIGYAKPGDEVVLKIDAFPWQRHGLMSGKLLTVSEESFPTGGPGAAGAMGGPSRGGPAAVHRALVKITDARLANLPDGARLIPGMTLQAEIKVGERSVLSYFLNPLTRGLRESIREP
jgi:HlyD family secretion protein